MYWICELKIKLLRWVGRWRWEWEWKDGWIGSHASHVALFSPFCFPFGLYGWKGFVSALLLLVTGYRTKVGPLRTRREHVWV